MMGCECVLAMEDDGEDFLRDMTGRRRRSSSSSCVVGTADGRLVEYYGWDGK